MMKIRPHKRSDIPYRVKWFNNPYVAVNFDYVTTPTTIKKETEWFKRYEKDPAKKVFTICVDGDPIGLMGLGKIEKESKNAEVFIAIGEDAYRGKGYGHTAMTWLINYAFNTLRLHKVSLLVIDINKPARQLYKNLGFVVEGRKREDIKIKGKWHDMIVMALFKRDWKKK